MLISRLSFCNERINLPFEAIGFDIDELLISNYKAYWEYANPPEETAELLKELIDRILI